MKRLIIGGFIGFQPANDATEGFIELTEDEEEVVAAELAKGNLITADLDNPIIIDVDDEGYSTALGGYMKAQTESAYFKRKVAKAKKAVEAETVEPFEERLKKVRKEKLEHP